MNVKYFRFHDPSWWFLLRQISDYFPVVSRKTHDSSLPWWQLPSQADQLVQILSPTGSLSDNRCFRFGVSFKVLHGEQTNDQDFRHYFGTSLLMALLTLDTRSDFGD